MALVHKRSRTEQLTCSCTVLYTVFFFNLNVIFSIAKGVEHDGRLPFWKLASVFAHYVCIVIACFWRNNYSSNTEIFVRGVAGTLAARYWKQDSYTCCRKLPRQGSDSFEAKPKCTCTKTIWLHQGPAL